MSVLCARKQTRCMVLVDKQRAHPQLEHHIEGSRGAWVSTQRPMIFPARRSATASFACSIGRVCIGMSFFSPERTYPLIVRRVSR